MYWLENQWEGEDQLICVSEGIKLEGIGERELSERETTCLNIYFSFYSISSVFVVFVFVGYWREILVMWKRRILKLSTH